MLVSTLNLVVAQRLVRKLCTNCKEPTDLDDHTLEQLKIDPAEAKKHIFYRSRGCRVCEQTGYLGRLPIFEILSMTDLMRKAILSGTNELQIKAMAQEAGGGSLLESGAQKVSEGVTTAEEVLKVTFTDQIEL